MIDFSNLTDGLSDLANQGQDAAQQAIDAAADAAQTASDSATDLANQAGEALPTDHFNEQVNNLTDQAGGITDIVSDFFSKK